MSASTLYDRIRELRSGGVGEEVRRRVAEFHELSSRGAEEWFSELCFCILTANSSAVLGLRIQREVGAEGFLTWPQERLARRLSELGHQYAERRAEFIVEARGLGDVKEIVTRFGEERLAREWLVENVKGLGYKEASHFLRNVGYLNVAVLDRHVLRALAEHGVIDEVPKTLTKRRYLEIERRLEALAENMGLTLGELDLYLWYTRTGRVLK
ncbi:MAG: N-glycosylase/DNA lyase [Candidatus Bathyarchaeia archaeon]